MSAPRGENLRSRRLAGRDGAAVHAPHPDDPARPLCPVRISPRYGAGWEDTWQAATCRACLKILGKELPQPKRMPAKTAARKALIKMGLDGRRHSFDGRDRLIPKSQTGGIRIVDYTTVRLTGGDDSNTALDRAQELIALLWTNGYGRHRWQLWAYTSRRDGLTWAVLSTEEDCSIQQELLGHRLVASYRDLPDADLYWGE